MWISSVPFPVGMASTERIKALALGLVGAGVRVCVIGTRPPDYRGQSGKQPPSCQWHGVRYVNTSGFSSPPSSPAMRALGRLIGTAGALRLLLALSAARGRSCAYVYTSSVTPLLSSYVLIALLRMLAIPVVLEMNEAPWPLRNPTNPLWTRLSPLFGVSGVVAISTYLQDWVHEVSSMRGNPLPTIRVPILVVEDAPIREMALADPPQVLLAVGAGYESSVEYVMDAMTHVWQRHPECRLVITGGSGQVGTTSPPGDADRRDNIRFAGVLSWDALVSEYAQSAALLAPLFEDTISRARFPTKIGEYLMSGRPVVISPVGDAPLYLEPAVSAFVAASTSAADFAKCIVEILENPAMANAVGLRGRETARAEFSCRRHGPRLAAFLRALVDQSVGAHVPTNDASSPDVIG